MQKQVLSPIELIRRILQELHARLLSLVHRLSAAPSCKLCKSDSHKMYGYGRLFYKCSDCGFIFSNEYNPASMKRGMGLEGSWSGPGGGGYREYWLAKTLAKDMGFEHFLLYGTGKTPALPDLITDGIDAVGCDVSDDVIAQRRNELGTDKFFSPDNLPANRKYDAIIAVEVIEHFTEPETVFTNMLGMLSERGLICGTTNFYPGGDIEDINNPGYMSHRGHVAYWSHKSLSKLAAKHSFEVTEFEMECPGSVKPDDKYGQLWPNKRVFFIHRSNHTSFFSNLKSTSPILPIDKP